MNKLNFKTDSPILKDVKIVDEWISWDGPILGICEINGQKFFFMDLVESIWRYYEDDTHQRLWRIYGVYDIDIEEVRKTIRFSRYKWEPKIIESTNCIGIFYE